MCQVRVESKSEQANVVGGFWACMSAVNAVLENCGSVDVVTALRRRYSSQNTTTRVLSRGGVSEHSASQSPLTRLRQHCTTQARAGALMAHHPAWVGHTGGSRSTPTVHPCLVRQEGCRWLTYQKHYNHHKMSPPQNYFNIFVLLSSFLLGVFCHFLFLLSFFCARSGCGAGILACVDIVQKTAGGFMLMEWCANLGCRQQPRLPE